MQKSLRILTHGWQATAVSSFTFGYYDASTSVISQIADWCISDAVLYVWIISDETRLCA